MLKIFAKKIYDGKGGIINNSTIYIENSKIVKILEGKHSPDYRAEVITPAFIDAHSHIGLERHGEGIEEDDTNEKADSIITFGDALDGIQMDDKSFADSVENGVLYSCVLHGSGNIIGSRAVVIKNFEKNTKEAFIKYAGYKAALGHNPKSTEEWKGTRFSTRIGILSHLRKYFLKAERELELLKRGKKDEEELDIEDLFFINLIRNKEYLRVHLHKEDDLFSLLRLSDRFGFNFVIEHACDFHNVEPYMELKRRNTPVVYGPLDSFSYKVELKHENWKNIRYLLSSGVKFGIMSDHPVILQSNLFLTLRWFLRFGMREAEAISLITSKNASILGLSELGVVSPKKIASLLLWNGEPFDVRNRIIHIVKEGIVEDIEY